MNNACTLATALGPITLRWNDRGLVCAIDLLTEVAPAPAAKLPPPAQRVATAIQAHLAGQPAQYALADLDLSACTAFARQVYTYLHDIPPGQTRTYGQLAAALGKPGAARAVGRAMATNPVPLAVPCHRVVARHGLGGFTGGLDFKRRLLAMEGARLIGE